MKSNRTVSTDTAPTDPTTNPTPVEAPLPRPAPKRKFEIRLGAMQFEKRCTVAEMAATIAATQGAKAYLVIDGYSFEFREEAVTTPEPSLSLE